MPRSVVPEFDTPGHADSVCVGYPAACPSPSCTSPLAPDSPLTLQLVSGVLQEWAGIFPGAEGEEGGPSVRLLLLPPSLLPLPLANATPADAFLHLGGDEVDEACWASSPAVRAWMTAQGMGNDTDLVYEWFVQQASSRGGGEEAHAQLDAFLPARTGGRTRRLPVPVRRPLAGGV